MPETAETSVAAIVKANEPSTEKPRITVVTNENVNEYVREQMGTTAEPAAASPEAKAAEELKKVDAEKAKAKEDEVDHPEPTKKAKLNERFSELTEKRKAAEAQAEAKTKEAQDAAARAEAAERRAAELQAKYEPPKPDDLGPEPLPTQFADSVEYGKALKEWTTETTLRNAAKERAAAEAKTRSEALVTSFKEREAEARKSIKDYDDKIKNSSVIVSNEMQAAILESDVGPQIMAHLADHPDAAKTLREMPTAKMLREFGKLEATFAKGDKTTVTPKKEGAKVEISQAPAPISPLNGSGTAAEVSMTGGQEFHGTFEEYKAKRRAGQIK